MDFRFTILEAKRILGPRVIMEAALSSPRVLDERL
jgi:hypothetical protein